MQFDLDKMLSLVRWPSSNNSPLLWQSKCGSSTSAANFEVHKEVICQDKWRRKHGKYYHYDADVRVKVAKYACDHGNKAAAVKFTH